MTNEANGMTKEQHEQAMRPYLKMANCRLFSVGLVLVAGWLMVYVSGLTQLETSKDQGIWFQRSGSLLTIASLCATVWLAKLQQDLQGVGFGSLIPLSAYKLVERKHNILTFLTLASTFVGTLIWGYGDLFHHRVFC